MKKIFTLLSLVMLMFAVNASAQDRKTWDFTKGVSDESRAILDADTKNWTPTGSPSTAWTTNATVTGELKAGDVVVKEFAGLQFGDFGANNAVMYKITSLRLQKACSITLPALKSGQKVTIKAQSANTTATDRGFSLENAQDAESNSSFIILGRDAEGAPEGGVYTIVANVVSDGVVKLSTELTGDPKSGIEILSIVIDEGDPNIKRWDFSAFSAATVNQVCNATDWTTAESANKNYITGNEIRWINEPSFDANNDLTAGGTAIKEFVGLRHSGLAQYSLGLAFNYSQTLDGNDWGPYHGASYLWVMTAATKIVVPNVKAGSEMKLGVETHKLIPSGTSDARGFKLCVDGTEIAAAQTTTDYAEMTYAIPAGDDEYVDVEIVATKGCHLYYIEAEVKDEAYIDRNVVLGNPSYSIAEGAKLNTTAENLLITFPKRKNIEAGTEVSVRGVFASTGEGAVAEEVDLNGTVDGGVSLVFGEVLPLEENKSYKFYITAIEVTEHDDLLKEAAEGEELFPLTFITAGPGIDTPREWQFTLTQETAEQIAQSIDAGNSKWSAAKKGRYSVTSQFTNAPLTYDGITPIPNTDGLLFSMSNPNDILLGTPAHTGVGGVTNDGGSNGYIQLGGGSPELIIPECSKGDEVTIKAIWSTKNNGTITIENGKCGDSNVITLTGADADYTIVVENHGDLILKSKNAKYKSISIFPASMEKVKIQYTINATTEDGTVLKTLAEGEGQTNDKVSVAFPFYIKDAEGNLYTKGARGSQFQASVVLETGVNEYPLTYKQTTLDGMTKAVFCSEAEELEGSVMECTPANADVRASNQKVAYAVADVELCTLPAGTYKIKAMIWDAVKGGGSTVMKFKAGEQAIDMTSTGDNMSEVISEAFTLAADTKLVWVADANYAETYALDAIVVFGYDETLSGITDITTAAKAKVAKKLENGQIIIIKDNVKYNAAGVQVK